MLILNLMNLFFWWSNIFCSSVMMARVVKSLRGCDSVYERLHLLSVVFVYLSSGIFVGLSLSHIKI